MESTGAELVDVRALVHSLLKRQGGHMRSNISIDIYGVISDAETLNVIVEEALENCEGARLAAADSGRGQYDDMLAVAMYIERLAVSGDLLQLSRQDTRMDFSDLRYTLRSGNVGYVYIEHGESDESSGFRPGSTEEVVQQISLDDEPMFSFRQVQEARQVDGGIDELLARATSACVLPEGRRLDMAPGVMRDWIVSYASDADDETVDGAGLKR